MMAVSPRLLAAVLLALAPACQTRFAPEPVPVSEASVREATEVVAAAASAREDLELAEGGLVLDAWFLVWKEWEVWDPEEPWWPDGPRSSTGPRTERARVLEGPRRIYVPLTALRAVHVRAWSLGAGVELELAGEPEPAFLQVADRGEAERLASALDVLRRAAAASAPPP